MHTRLNEGNQTRNDKYNNDTVRPVTRTRVRTTLGLCLGAEFEVDSPLAWGSGRVACPTAFYFICYLLTSHRVFTLTRPDTPTAAFKL